MKLDKLQIRQSSSCPQGYGKARGSGRIRIGGIFIELPCAACGQDYPARPDYLELSLLREKQPAKAPGSCETRSQFLGLGQPEPASCS